MMEAQTPPLFSRWCEPLSPAEYLLAQHRELASKAAAALGAGGDARAYAFSGLRDPDENLYPGELESNSTA